MADGLLSYLAENSLALGRQTLEHIGLTIASVAAAVGVGLPLGILCIQSRKAASVVLSITGILQTIPSMALLGFMIPVLGIGALPAIVALFLYALLPIVRNTFTGIREVEPSVTEAALGMGLSKWQLITQVQLPLAMPTIFAGIRTATVINVGVATLAALIASGGLGETIFGGIALNNTAMILAGAIPAALLAIILDLLLAWIQQLNLYKIRSRSWFSIWIVIAGSTALLLFSSFQTSFRAGFTPEFMGMSEGYPGLQKSYALKLNTVVIQSGLMYNALHAGAVDVISGYSTDGRIREFRLATLEDDKSHFPDYQAGITVRQEVLNRYPELQPVLEKLSRKFTDQSIIELNYQVDVLKKSPASVASLYLDSLGLLNPAASGKAGIIRIGSKIFTEQYILAEIIAQLIEGHTELAAEVRAGMGGTQICFEALQAGAIDLYPEYSGTGLEVILKQKHLLHKSLKNDSATVYNFVNEQYQKQYNIRWLPPLGFNNTYALLMRNDQAQQLKIRTISDLSSFISGKVQVNR
ncbi:ABC transporter permease subunit [Rhodocytophaga rosea]|uniref:ABC transporter permease subunit n=1 Tax=Rhodocytophaga rosea TaxID=2704465 RepID=A0A6C0GDL3_9BACT|nr:ABC transporter permease/substrate-binding protein [Rhodocytophaga rosea]QHT66046.1 ABC transporter permease subunit [Rhodocytophaga rosea]